MVPGTRVHELRVGVPVFLRAPARHCLTAGKGGELPGHTHVTPTHRQAGQAYPVIHQKVILERKEALDSGQGF